MADESDIESPGEERRSLTPRRRRLSSPAENSRSASPDLSQMSPTRGQSPPATQGIMRKDNNSHDVSPKKLIGKRVSIAEDLRSNQVKHESHESGRASNVRASERASGESHDGRAIVEARSKRQMSRVITDLQFEVKVKKEEDEPDFLSRIHELDQTKATARDLLLHPSVDEKEKKTAEDRAVSRRRSVVFVKASVSARDSGASERKLPVGAVKMRGNKVWWPKRINPLQIELEKYMMKDLKEAYDLLENAETGAVLVDVIPTVVRACGSEPKQGEIDAILEKIKPHFPGQLELHEFTDIFKAKLDQEDTLDEIERAFRQMNISKSGRISIDDLRKVSQLVGYRLDDEELQLMIDGTNPTPEGEATLNGFVSLMKRKQWFDEPIKEARKKPHHPVPATQRFRNSYRAEINGNHTIKEEKFSADRKSFPSKPAGEALARLLPKIENYTATVPDAVLVDLMAQSGLSTDDPAIVRLISLAAQKWISSITYDALQHCKVRSSNLSMKSHHGGGSNRQDRRTLTMEDLTPALAEQGITVKRPPYYE